MNHYDLRNSPSSDRLREGSRSFAELHLISLISPKANLISIPSRRQHLSFQITDAAVKGIRRDFDILCRRVSSMDEGAALAAACSFVRSFCDGGSGLDSESAPSRTLAPHSPSEREREREREGGRERRKQAVSPPSALLQFRPKGLGFYVLLRFLSALGHAKSRRDEGMSF